MLSTTPAYGRTEGAQCSWKLDSSTANRSTGSVRTSSTGLPMLPHSALRRPSASSMACSIDVVVVLPLVPVTTSQRRGAPNRPAASSRQASSTSPHTGTPAAAAATSTGAVGGSPGLVTTSAKSPIRFSAAAGSSTATPRSACGASAAGLSSQSVARTSNGANAARTARPVMPAPTTSTAAPGSSGASPAVISRSDGGEPLAVAQRHPQPAGDRGEQPEPDDHRGLGPADQFEVVVERRHPEHPPAGGAEHQDLHHHRGDLGDEQRAQHDRQDLGAAGHRQAGDDAAQR